MHWPQKLAALVKLGCGLVAIAAAVSAEASPPADYLRDVKPLLRERCYACHGALKQKGQLRLDTVASMLRGGENGPVVEPPHPEKSILIQRTTTTNLDERMPPLHEGEPFKPEQIALLRAWITSGAPAPTDDPPEKDPRDHWAFRPIQRPSIPATPGDKKDSENLSRWARNPIDDFIAQQQALHQLTPLPPASREIRLRRLSFDLLGLPPSEQDIETALGDPTESWYEAAVDRMLADPRHGERWARHWMDIWRYSDWWGLGDQLRNSQKHIWHWRDWLVESVNADLPYDEMIRLMLAADELHPNDLGKLRATGFLARNWFLFNRNQWLEETVEHVSKGLLGLTLNCAKCHDHKYDPLPQADFYRMRAFFEPYHVRLDVLPEEPDLEKDGLPRVYDGPADVPTYRFVRGQESQPDKSVVLAPAVPALLNFAALDLNPVSLPLEAWQPERRPWVIDRPIELRRAALPAEESRVRERTSALGSALRAEADLLTTAATNTSSNPVQRQQAREKVDRSRQELAVAEASLALARAELRALEHRADATRASWKADAASGHDPVLEAAEVRANRAAVAAVRDADVARAARDLAELELRRAQTAQANNPRNHAPASHGLEAELKTARETLEKARQTAAAPVQPEDSYPPFAGARWTATRFLNSTKDDPAVPFRPQSSGRRKALAAWLTDRRNPLPARVAVNHVWMRHFGTALVATPFDFGRKGTPPTHPELLDWLAAELIDSGWSLKHLHRLIVTSAAYQLSSSQAGDLARANAARDPDNVRLWRRTPLRLEAEAVRDALLTHAGTLDLRRGGPPVPAPQQADSKRRSLYFFHSNNDRNSFLTTFDGAAVKECYRRDQSIVPQQALALTNSRLVQDAAIAIASRWSEAEPGDAGAPDDDVFVRRAFQRLLGFRASDAELAASRHALASWRRQNPAAKPAEVRAELVHTLINHNDFVTLR